MSEETIFREVDESLRSERMRKLWRRTAPFLFAAALAVVLAVAANEGWTWYQNSNSAEASDQFFTALDRAQAGDLAGAQTSLDEAIADGHGGYPMLARFKQASLLWRDGKPDEAVTVYDEIANTQSDARMRELALLLAGNVLVDSGDLAAVEARVGSLAAPDNVLRNSAREALGLANYKAGNLDAARDNFDAILGDPLASQDQQGRVQIYLGQLTAEGAEDPEQPMDGEGDLAPASGDAPAAEPVAPPEPAPAN